MTAVFYILLLLTEHHGQVMFGGVPVPGATVTATQAGKTYVATTDSQGAYSFPDLAEGTFTIQVQMLGFSTIKQDVTMPTAEFELKMLPLEDMRAEVVHNAPAEPPPAATAAASAAPAPAGNGRQPAANNNNRRGAANTPAQAQTGFQRTEVNASATPNATPANNNAPAQPSAFANLSQEDLSQRAQDSALINGTVNNGAASPFAQLAQFGNNRRGRPLYTGNASAVIGNSALDARSYSLAGLNTQQPSYNKFTGSFNVGGPLRIPHLIKPNNAPTFFFGYQRQQNRNGNTLTGRMPTEAERAGDFSQTISPLGAPVQILDPANGQPFAGNVLPAGRISPQARALLNLFPLPNFTSNPQFNYQIATADASHSDGVQGRINKSLNARNQIVGNINVQSSRSDNTNLFRFLDASRTLGMNGGLQWTNRPTQRFSMTFQYQFSRQTARLVPYFANQLNVSGIAGITGNNQEAVNWGSPALLFSNGLSGLSDGQYSNNRTQNHTFGYNSFWNHGRHNITFGGDIRRYQLNVLAQQDARGTFTFTGAAAGYDFAGFLLGIPDASSIAFGNADKYYRQTFSSAFFRDDWRVSGSLTLNLGLQWEYETPSSELRGRLVNLKIAPDFSSIAPVVGNGLVHSDPVLVQPRVSMAWRPIAASSLIVRGNYGMYRNTNVYQTIANQMAQQSPLSTSLSVSNTQVPLTLANGFIAQNSTPNTFAVDPNFRIGYVQSWSLSVQRDLPAALQMTAMYLGTKGSQLPQEFLPNTFPSSALSPSGYVFLTSSGASIRNAGQIQIRRRLRSGFTATTQYTYARAFDNAPLMAGGVATTTQGGSSIAQNWLNLKAERAPSNFDQRHQLSVQTQYTTGVGLRGGALLGGWKGGLFKEWTLASQLTVGSGTPLTPTFISTVPGTGVTGTRRPDRTTAPLYLTSGGRFLNPAAFQAPAPGQWGNAGRNSITGPSQFVLNASLGRSFPWHDRYNIDVRVDASNVLNHVTFRNWNTTFVPTPESLLNNNTQFGLPGSPNGMRTIQTTARLRF